MSSGSMAIFLGITDWPFYGKDGIVCRDNTKQQIRGEYLDGVTHSQSSKQNGSVFRFGSSSVRFAGLPKDAILNKKLSGYIKQQKGGGKTRTILRISRSKRRLLIGPIMVKLRKDVTRMGQNDGKLHPSE